MSNLRKTIIFCLVILIGLVMWSYWFVNKSNPKVITEAQKKLIISNFSKIMILPQGEDPTVAIVEDVSKLKNQPFFTKAMNGDEVIIYPLAKKAILFRPKLGKIVDFAIINLTNSY